MEYFDIEAVWPVCVWELVNSLPMEVEWGGALYAYIFYSQSGQHWKIVHKEPTRGNVTLMSKKKILVAENFIIHCPHQSPREFKSSMMLALVWGNEGNSKNRLACCGPLIRRVCRGMLLENCRPRGARVVRGPVHYLVLHHYWLAGTRKGFRWHWAVKEAGGWTRA